MSRQRCMGFNDNLVPLTVFLNNWPQIAADRETWKSRQAVAQQWDTIAG